MGTYNVIGLGRLKDGTRRMYMAMNRVEIMQQRHQAASIGDKVVTWYPQTAAGLRVLGPKCYTIDCDVLDAEVPSVHMVTCPYCHGRGQNENKYCPVCNGSGLMKPGNEKHWQQWQLDSMKAEAEKVTAGLVRVFLSKATA